jgi:hypothetical protein
MQLPTKEQLIRARQPIEQTDKHSTIGRDSIEPQQHESTANVQGKPMQLTRHAGIVPIIQKPRQAPISTSATAIPKKVSPPQIMAKGKSQNIISSG